MLQSGNISSSIQILKGKAEGALVVEGVGEGDIKVVIWMCLAK